MVDLSGTELSVRHWAAAAGIPADILYERLTVRFWSVERALMSSPDVPAYEVPEALVQEFRVWRRDRYPRRGGRNT